MNSSKSTRRSDRLLAILLRVFGGVDLLAVLAVFMPSAWMHEWHSRLGLGEFPDAPIVDYLARSTSALYALHGAMLVFISFDVQGYRRLITFLAIATIIHGMVLLGVDLSAGLPTWWTWLEGPSFSTTGVVVLWIQCGSGGRTCRRPGSTG